MIKFIIEKFRTAPGPLKQPRLILADLAEEVFDTAVEYAGKRQQGGGSAAEGGWDAPRPPAEGGPDGAPKGAPAAPVEEAPPAEPIAPKRTLEVDPALEVALNDGANVRKQDFKVLAILWDASQRGLVPLSAKGVADYGEQMGLAIRHENVRKVIRMRLEKYVDYHNEGAGSGTIYRYALNAVGRDHFDDIYLRESER